MTKLRRFKDHRTLYFITIVTHNRQPLLVKYCDLWWQAAESTELSKSGRILAWVILPTHCHLLVDVDNIGLSTLIQRFKMSFGARLRKRQERRSGRVWQNRFWDHIIRDENDMNRHVDYIHYNPTKHGLIDSPFDWRHSSIHEEQYRGAYPKDWGMTGDVIDDGEYGE